MHISRQDLMIRMSILFALIVCNVFYSIPFFSCLALMLFCLFMYYNAIRQPYFILKYFSFVWASSAVIVGTTLCEFAESYLDELLDYGHYVGSLPLLVTQHVILFTMLAFFDAMIKKPPSLLTNSSVKQDKYSNMCHYISVMCVAVLLVLFLRIARKPAFLLGMDRTTYNNEFNVRSGIFNNINNNAFILVTFPMLDYFNGHKRIGKISIILYVMYFLWSGNKFGPFLTLLVTFILVNYSEILKIDKNKVAKFIYVALFIVGLLIIAASLLAVNTYSGVFEDYLISRTAKQGQLWWKTFAVTDRPHIDEFDDELSYMFKPATEPQFNVGAKYGQFKIMYLCAPPRFISMVLKGGTIYTSSGFASAYYYLMIPSVLIYAVFSAFLISIIINALLSAIKAKNCLRIIILMKFLQLARGALSTFQFNVYFSLTSIICYVALIADYWYEYSVNKRIADLKAKQSIPEIISL